MVVIGVAELSADPETRALAEAREMFEVGRNTTLSMTRSEGKAKEIAKGEFFGMVALHSRNICLARKGPILALCHEKSGLARILLDNWFLLDKKILKVRREVWC